MADTETDTKPRARKAAPDDAPKAVAVTEEITYVPSPGDPPSVKWGGLVFQANVPKTLTGHPEGSDREKLNHQLIVSARTNKFFKCGSAKDKPVDNGPPKTPEQYRSHVVTWLKRTDGDGKLVVGSTEALMAQWQQDAPLREACGVGSDDYAYLGSLIEPRLAELARADGLSVNQVAALWVEHGVNQLPW